ncbi:MAG: phenylacetate--CoA ligase family protein [Planctomycetaceae bacterium]|nr:phenylacetate--CoA ligase family protein [Planctomycetaceae bacterium]
MAVFNFLKTAFLAGWRERHGRPEHFARIASSKLERLLNHARQNVPLQMERLATVTEFAQIRPIAKLEMMTRFAESLAVNSVTGDEVMCVAGNEQPGSKWIRDRYLVTKTSGSTGERGIFVTDLATWESQRATIFSRISRGLSPWRRLRGLLRGERFRMAHLVGDCPFCVTRQSALDSQHKARRLCETRLLSIMDPLEKSIQALNEFQPHFLYLYPSVLVAIAKRRQQTGQINFAPNALIVGCEMLTESDRHVITEAFPGSRLVNQYGASECPALAVSCPAGQLHVNLEHALIEPVDADNQPVAVGELSDKILLTNLDNFVQPFIRYEISDRVRLIDKPCPCGSPLPVIEVHGRADDTIHLLDSKGQVREILPLTILTSLFGLAELNFHQVAHVRQNVIELRIHPTPGVPFEAAAVAGRSALSRALRVFGVDSSVTVQVTALDSIPRQSHAGKFKSVVSEVPPPNKSAGSRRSA